MVQKLREKFKKTQRMPDCFHLLQFGLATFPEILSMSEHLTWNHGVCGASKPRWASPSCHKVAFYRPLLLGIRLSFGFGLRM